MGASDRSMLGQDTATLLGDDCSGMDRSFHGSCRKGRDYSEQPLVLRYNFKRPANGLVQGVPQTNFTQHSFGGSDTQVVTSVKLFQGAPTHAVGRVDVKYRKSDGSIATVPNPMMTTGLGIAMEPYVAMAEAGGPWRSNRECTSRALDGRDEWSGSHSWHFRQWTYFLWEQVVDVHQMEFAQCCGGFSGDGHTARNLLIQKLLDGADPENDDSWETFTQYTGAVNRVHRLDIEPGQTITAGIRIRGGDAAPGSGNDTPDGWYRFNYVSFTAFKYIDQAVVPHFAKATTPSVAISFDPIETDMLQFDLYKFAPPTCEALLSEEDHCGRAPWRHTTTTGPVRWVSLTCSACWPTSGARKLRRPRLGS